MEPPIRLAVIIGSTREGRFGPKVAGWLEPHVRTRAEFELDVVDLAAADLPAVLPAAPDPAVERYRRRLEEADAFVVLTPEYNHGYPAPLKQAVDLAHREWRAKPVAFVSYGGMSGGVRAVEQLRQVFAELHAVTVRDGVSFHNVWHQLGLDGHLRADPGAEVAATTMLDRLAWWAVALRRARLAQPYVA